MTSDDPFGTVDPDGLADADWVTLSALRTAFEKGGHRAIEEALDALAKTDPIRHANVIGVLSPSLLRSTLKATIAPAGIDGDDFRELVRRIKVRARLH